MNIGIGRPLITSPSAICIFCISVAKTIQCYTIHYALVLFILISLQSEKYLVLYYFEVRYECLLKKIITKLAILQDFKTRYKTTSLFGSSLPGGRK